VSLDLPKVYPITDRRLSGRGHAEQVHQFAAAGSSFVQLREKHLSPAEFFIEAKAAAEAARQLGVTLIINDRVDIALAVGAAGVHLGQDDLPPAAAREILGGSAIIGYSTHSIEQAEEAKNLPVDYIAFGPIFPTVTKENPDPVTGVDLLRKVCRLAAPLPVVAIGGIDETNIRNVIEAGAASAAIISALYTSSGMDSAYARLFSEINNV
jgi:thiamine-phosphate pyrophosphorylase